MDLKQLINLAAGVWGNAAKAKVKYMRENHKNLRFSVMDMRLCTPRQQPFCSYGGTK